MQQFDICSTLDNLYYRSSWNTRCETQNFIALLTKVCHWVLLWVTWIHSSLHSTYFIQFILMLSSRIFFFLWPCGPTRVMASSFLRFLDHTQRRTTVGRTPLDEWSARRRDLYLTTHNNHNRQTTMPPVGFEPTISAGEQPQNYAFDRAAIRTGYHPSYAKYLKATISVEL